MIWFTRHPRPARPRRLRTYTERQLQRYDSVFARALSDSESSTLVTETGDSLCIWIRIDKGCMMD